MVMAATIGTGNEELRARHRATQPEQQPVHHNMGEAESAAHLHQSSALLGDERLSGRGNSSLRSSVMHTMQSTHGNRAVQRVLQAGANPEVAEEEDDQIAERIERMSTSEVGSELPTHIQAKLETSLGMDMSG